MLLLLGWYHFSDAKTQDFGAFHKCVTDQPTDGHSLLSRRAWTHLIKGVKREIEWRKSRKGMEKRKRGWRKEKSHFLKEITFFFFGFGFRRLPGRKKAIPVLCLSFAFYLVYYCLSFSMSVCLSVCLSIFQSFENLHSVGTTYLRSSWL